MHDSTDPLSAGINVRGDKNYLYSNYSYNNAGAGVRLGGDIAYNPDYGNSYQYGAGNILRNNIVWNNRGAGYKFITGEQNADYSNAGFGNGNSLYLYGDGVKPFICD